MMVTLDDVKQWESEIPKENQQQKFVPTLKDVQEWDKEAAGNKKVKIPSYNEEPYAYAPTGGMVPYASPGIGKGMVQSLYNAIPGLPKKDISQGSPGSEYGSGIANALLMMAPGRMLSAAGKVSEIVPVLNKLFGGVKKVSDANKLLSGIGKAGKMATEGAIGGAMLTPENRLGGAAVGAPLNALTGGTVNALGSENPIVNLLARTGLGAGAGAGIGSMTPYGALKGAGVGAGLGAGLPIANKLFGLSRLSPGAEILQNIKPEDVKQRFEAGLRTGRTLSPSESSGLSTLATQEGKFARGGEAAIEKGKIAEENINKEKKQIQDVLHSIYDKSEISNQKIRDLYEKAYRWNLKPKIMSQMKEDTVIDQAFNDVKNDAGWQRKLKDIPENNFKYLDAVKKSISDRESKLLNKEGGKELAKEYGEARRDLTDAMDNISPHYKQAREEAQRSIVRSQLQKKLVSTKGTGTDFYNKILKNDDKFNELIKSLKNAPEAQDKLRDMKLAWEHLINPTTPRTAYGQTQIGLTQSRNWKDALLEAWYDFTGNKRNVEATKLLNSPEWIKEFDNIKNLKTKQAREKEIIKMFSSVGSIGTGSAIAKEYSRSEE